MASPIDAQLVLCDSAVAEQGGGKVHMLGAGWSITSSPTGPHAVVALLKIPWDRANQKLTVMLELVDDDGHPVTLDTPAGPQTIRGQGTIEVGRPAGIAHGSMLDASFVLSVGQLPLPPGRYQYRLEIAGSPFAASFTVRER